ncbi:MAG: hypothetical protein Q7J31_06570 [Syntrophales bacterium]|nr:hypothetical protein [Syntrophales bacterium]
MRYKVNPDVNGTGHPHSLCLVTQYIYLSEAQAVAHHDGQHSDNNRIIAYKKNL